MIPASNLQQLRMQLNHQRQALPADQYAAFSEQATSNLLDCIKQLSTPPAKIGLYWPVKQEIDTTKAISTLLKDQYQVYLPYIHPIHPNQFWFAPYRPHTRLKLNRFQIPEPSIHSSYDLLASWELDLIVLPLVAFDPQGNRLGMGSGFYDRCCHFRKSLCAPPWLIGLAFAFQEVTQLENRSWDVPLDAVVTNSGLRKFSFKL